MNFSKQLKKYRESKHFSQEELAEKIYVTRQTISKWENDKSYPDIHNLIALSVLFDITLDELVKGDRGTMKKEIANSKLNFWTMNMLVMMVVTPVSIAPVFKFLGFKGLVLPIILSIWLMYSALKIEGIKKKNNIKTYSEIVAFMDNKPIDNEKNEAEYKRLNQMKLVYAIIAGVFSIILLEISFLLFY